ncbi:MAG TPA: adenylate/guanylate cyclase domain-containing protein [Thermodesulfobacteriota bacterium]|jgi:TolB-like protein/class 3 adenylate cyclase|nr:adenylate/guanylate cyclase domain-containing protein [Thermodesulfobacteriota bacterium]
MTTQGVKRKLTAILSADVKGYSRLMGKDDVGTIQTLNTYKEVMAGLVLHHHGRVVDAPGDNVLAEFASVVDAVECAVEIQKELKARNDKLPLNRRMEFRIGINLGDVVEEEDKIFGDGVNIAARMQSLSDGGGLCISGTVYEHIKNKLTLRYGYLGKQRVKNIVGPVKVYRVMIEPETLVSVVSRWKRAGVNYWKRVHPVFKIAIALVAAANVLWQFYPYLRPSGPPVEVTPKEKVIEVASKEKMAFPLPDVPSIAVLPFVNMSGDPKQEFLCDGMTEEIITALSKVPRLFVIARNSTFTYKGKPVKVKQISEELGVRYVLEGSVQRSGDRVRITAQLIDALTGNHLWAERYERDLKDIFALQDEITLRILTAIQVKLTEGEQASMSEKSYEKYYRGKQGLDCYMKNLEANKYLQGQNIEDVKMGRRIAEEAIAMCPESPGAYVTLGLAHLMEYWMGSGKSPQESIEKGIEMAQKALSMDDSIADSHALLCVLYDAKKEYDKAIAEGERAVALSPSSTFAYESYALTLMWAGRPEEAIPLLQKAIRLNPFAPSHAFYSLGHALRMTGRFEEAVSAYKKAIQFVPDNIIAHVGLAGTYSMMGREKEAHAEAAEVLRINPKFSLDLYTKNLALKDQSEIDKYANALRKAGLK